MRTAFAEAGFEPVFEKVAVKPGKPTWFSKYGNVRVLGLPGNPASAFVCAYLFLRPLLGHTEGLNLRPARLSSPLPANGDRDAFLRAQVLINDDVQLQVTPAPNQDSSLIHPFLSANCFIHRPANASASTAGDLVSIDIIGAL